MNNSGKRWIIQFNLEGARTTKQESEQEERIGPIETDVN